jgi:hypothetical protein
MEHAREATMNFIDDHERTITLKHLQQAVPLMRFDVRADAGPPVIGAPSSGLLSDEAVRRG